MITHKIAMRHHLLHNVFPVVCGLFGGGYKFFQLNSLWNMSYWDKLGESFFAALVLGAAGKIGADVYVMAKKRLKMYFNKKTRN